VGEKMPLAVKHFTQLSELCVQIAEVDTTNAIALYDIIVAAEVAAVCVGTWSWRIGPKLFAAHGRADENRAVATAKLLHVCEQIVVAMKTLPRSGLYTHARDAFSVLETYMTQYRLTQECAMPLARMRFHVECIAQLSAADILRTMNVYAPMCADPTSIKAFALDALTPLCRVDDDQRLSLTWTVTCEFAAQEKWGELFACMHPVFESMRRSFGVHDVRTLRATLNMSRATWHTVAYDIGDQLLSRAIDDVLLPDAPISAKRFYLELLSERIIVRKVQNRYSDVISDSVHVLRALWRGGPVCASDLACAVRAASEALVCAVGTRHSFSADELALFGVFIDATPEERTTIVGEHYAIVLIRTGREEYRERACAILGAIAQMDVHDAHAVERRKTCTLRAARECFASGFYHDAELFFATYANNNVLTEELKREYADVCASARFIRATTPSAAAVTAAAAPAPMESSAYSETECALCMDAERSVVFLPCTHACSCSKCALECKQCPICRAPVTSCVNFINA